MHRTLLSTTAGAAGFLFAAAVGATPFSFSFGDGPLGDLGVTHIWTSGGVTLTATALGSGIPHLFAKNDGPDERLLGETGSRGDNEITSDNGRGIGFSVSVDPGLTIDTLLFSGNSTDPADTGAILVGGMQVATFATHAPIDLTAFLSESFEVIALPLVDQPAGSNDTVGIGSISGTTSPSVTPIPEPSSLMILATGLIGLSVFSVFGRRRSRKWQR